MKKRHTDILAFSPDQLPRLNNELRELWDWLNRLEIVSSVPTGGNNGDMKIYVSGSTKRIYFKQNDTWDYITIGSGTVDEHTHTFDDLSDVSINNPTNNDIIRYNSATGQWESCAEPFDFIQINLIPRSTYVEDIEGGMYYNSSDNSVYVGTE